MKEDFVVVKMEEGSVGDMMMGEVGWKGFLPRSYD